MSGSHGGLRNSTLVDCQQLKSGLCAVKANKIWRSEQFLVRTTNRTRSLEHEEEQCITGWSLDLSVGSNLGVKLQGVADEVTSSFLVRILWVSHCNVATVHKNHHQSWKPKVVEDEVQQVSIGRFTHLFSNALSRMLIRFKLIVCYKFKHHNLMIRYPS